jgi:hypothetical protein
MRLVLFENLLGLPLFRLCDVVEMILEIEIGKGKGRNRVKLKAEGFAFIVMLLEFSADYEDSHDRESE